MLIVVGSLASVRLLLGDMVTMSELKSDGCSQLCDVSSMSSRSCEQQTHHKIYKGNHGKWSMSDKPPMYSCQNWNTLIEQSDRNSLIEQSHQDTLIMAYSFMREKQRKARFIRNFKGWWPFFGFKLLTDLKLQLFSRTEPPFKNPRSATGDTHILRL